MFYAVVNPPHVAFAKSNSFIAAVEQRARQRLKHDLVARIEFSRRALVNVRRNLSAWRQFGHYAPAKLDTINAVKQIQHQSA
jgi:hypothetical protein